MHTVSLSLGTEDGTLIERIEAHFESDDIQLFQRYIANTNRLAGALLLKRGMPSISHMSLIGETAPLFKCDHYENSELYELLHLLRPIILSKEPSSFERVIGLLGKRLSNERFRAHLKGWRTIFEDGELKLYMQITLNDRPLFDDSTLKLWLNGSEYHQDTEKSEQWTSFANSLTEANTRAFLITQLQSKVKAAFGIAHIAKLIISKIDTTKDI